MGTERSPAAEPWRCTLWCRMLAVSVAVACLSGCFPQVVKDQHAAPSLLDDGEMKAARELLGSTVPASVRGAAPTEPLESDAWRRRAVSNSLLTSYLRDHEGPLYRARDADGDSNGTPRYCLALSGGGMRTLAFGTGVLHGLQKRGLYGRVAVQSAASGGGYINYWMAANAERGLKGPEPALGSESEFLRQLRAHAQLLPPAAKATYATAVLVNPSRHSWLHQAGRRLSASQAEPAQKNFSGGLIGYSMALNGMLGTRSPVGVDYPLSASDLRAITAAGFMPLPVWTTTMRPAAAPDCVGAEPRKEIAERGRPLGLVNFENGPVRSGSDELGYLSGMLLSPLEATAVSGAGMSVPFNEGCESLHLADASVEITHYPPLIDPAMPQDESVATRNSQTFVLTDGGIADNLGVLPLVRRLCSDIIIVDGEFDPYLVFPGYGYLKQQLAKLDIGFSVPGIDAVALKNRLPTDPSVPHTDCDGGVCLVEPKPECVRRDASAGCVAADQLPASVFDGEIGPIPFATSVPTESGAQSWEFSHRVLRVHYVKLSLDGAHLESYPRTVRERYASHAGRRQKHDAPCVTTRSNDACSFPHEPTADLDYRHGKFEAYWDLGRCIVEQHWPDPANGQAAPVCGDSDWTDVDTALPAPCAGCSLTSKTAMVVPSGKAAPDLVKLSHQAGATADVLTVKREPLRLRLNESDGNALQGLDLDELARSGRRVAVRVPFDELALVYDTTGAIPHEATYPSLPVAGADEQKFSCEEADLELQRTEAIRWYARQQGGTPFSTHEIARQHEKKAIYYAAIVLLAAAVASAECAHGLSHGCSPSMPPMGPPPTPRVISLQAFRGSVNAADSREIALLQIRREKSCPAQATYQEGDTDLAILERIEQAQREVVAHKLSEVEQLRQQTRWLDELDPQFDDAGARMRSLVRSLLPTDGPVAAFFGKARWYSNVAHISYIRADSQGLSGSVVITSTSIAFVDGGLADSAATGSATGTVLRIPYSEIAVVDAGQILPSGAVAVSITLASGQVDRFEILAKSSFGKVNQSRGRHAGEVLRKAVHDANR